MNFARAPRHEAEITLTPLIDILFIVLLFLVLTATFTEQTVLRVALPRSVTGERDVQDQLMLRVVIDAEGQIYVDGGAYTPDGIRARLGEMPPDRARVSIAADRHATHGAVIQVLDLVRQAGIVRVEIQTFANVAR